MYVFDRPCCKTTPNKRQQLTFLRLCREKMKIRKTFQVFYGIPRNTDPCAQRLHVNWFQQTRFSLQSLPWYSLLHRRFRQMWCRIYFWWEGLGPFRLLSLVCQEFQESRFRLHIWATHLQLLRCQRLQEGHPVAAPFEIEKREMWERFLSVIGGNNIPSLVNKSRTDDFPQAFRTVYLGDS